MAYIPDGSGIDYDHKRLYQPGGGWLPGGKIKNYYPWGWLGDEVPNYLKGWKDPIQKQLFLDYIKTNGKASMHHFGTHDCEICGKAEFNGSLIVFHNGILFRAPWDVSHYIREHDYNPGAEVLFAIMNGEILTDDNNDYAASKFLGKHIKENMIGGMPQQAQEPKKNKVGRGKIWRIVSDLIKS